MKFQFIIIAAIAPVWVMAQDNLNRQVDVAREYTPLVDDAAKLLIKPHTADTTTLTPDFEYSVAPRAWVSGFDVKPIRAAQVATKDPSSQPPFYLKAGGGVPGQSVLDLYVTSMRAGATGGGLYINHRGRYFDIDKVDATSTVNSAGLFGRLQIGRVLVAGEAGMDYDAWADYLRDARKQTYITPRAGIVVGSDFTDLRRANFRMGGDGYFFEDRYDNKERGGNIFAEFGKQIGEGDMRVRADLDTWRTDLTNNTIFTIGPRYDFAGEGIVFGMGARFAYEKYDSRQWFLPSIEFRYAAAVSPYFTVESRLADNTWRAIAVANPFLDPVPGVTNGATGHYDVHGGVLGSIGPMVAYNLFLGYEIDRNVLLASSAAGYFARRVEAYAGGLETEFRTGRVTVTAMGKYMVYRQLRRYLPALKASLTGKYVQERWSVWLGGEVRSGYRFHGTQHEAPLVVDVSLGADYNLTKKVGFFFEGHNLANQQLYPQPLHRGMGINFCAGVKLKL